VTGQVQQVRAESVLATGPFSVGVGLDGRWLGGWAAGPDGEQLEPRLRAVASVLQADARRGRAGRQPRRQVAPWQAACKRGQRVAVGPPTSSGLGWQKGHWHAAAMALPWTIIT
jgi:hypothetical protein